jgi:hypothetical protein
MGWLRRQWWYLTLPRAQPAADDPPSSELPEDEQRRVREVLRCFDTADSTTRDEAWKQLPSGRLALPSLREAFPETRRMEARISMVCVHLRPVLDVLLRQDDRAVVSPYRPRGTAWSADYEP